MRSSFTLFGFYSSFGTRVGNCRSHPTKPIYRLQPNGASDWLYRHNTCKWHELLLHIRQPLKVLAWDQRVFPENPYPNPPQLRECRYWLIRCRHSPIRYQKIVLRQYPQRSHHWPAIKYCPMLQPELNEWCLNRVIQLWFHRKISFPQRTANNFSEVVTHPKMPP